MSAKITSLMQKALDKVGEPWGPFPADVYVRTLDAMKKRGLIEERFNAEGRSSRWEYRRTALAKATQESSEGGKT